MRDNPPWPPRTCIPLSTFQEIKEYCQRENKFLWQYVEEKRRRGDLGLPAGRVEADEGHGLRGPEHRGGAPMEAWGCSARPSTWCASAISMKAPKPGRTAEQCAPMPLPSARENAGGGRGGDSPPTCGASGVLPAVLLFKQEAAGVLLTRTCSTLWRRPG